MKKLLGLLLVVLFSTQTVSAQWKDVSNVSSLRPILERLEERKIVDDMRFFAPDGVVDGTFVNDLLNRERFSSRMYPSDSVFTQRMGLEALIEATQKDINSVPTNLFKRKVKGFTKADTALLQQAVRERILSLGEAQSFEPNKNLERRTFVRWVDALGKEAVKTEQKVVKGEAPEADTYKEDAMEELRQIIAFIDGEYVYEDEWKEKKKDALNEALKAYVKALGDPYTGFIPENESSKFFERLEGEFFGIGAYVEIKEEKFIIVAPLKNTPAEAVGLIPGDWVTLIDGESTDGKPIAEVVNEIKGPVGTKVILTVNRDGKVYEFPIVRKKITVPTLEWKIQNGVLVISIYQFSQNLRPLWDEMIEEIDVDHLKGMIIDVRNNPGGFLDQVLYVGQSFLKDRETAFFSRKKDNHWLHYVSEKDGVFSDFEQPVYVLQNKGSASASEILSGMLKDYERAIIVGETSFGKGTVQVVRNTKSGGVVKYTNGEWFTPLKNTINKTGIEPNIVFENIDKSTKRDLLIENILRRIENQ